MIDGAGEHGADEAVTKQEWRVETDKWAGSARRFLNNYRSLEHKPYKERIDFSNPTDALDAYLKGGASGRISVLYEDESPVRMTISVSPSDVHRWGDAMRGLLEFMANDDEQK